jgi:hypothetical protein
MEMSIKKIEYVYVAGLLTPRGIKSVNPAIEYIFNVRDIARIQVDLIFAGFTPYPTGMDFVYFIVLKDGERITEQMIKRISKNRQVLLQRKS